MQLEWPTPGVRAAVLKEWVAFVRRRLDAGAARASACAARLLHWRPGGSQGFLEVSEAREQMHKNKFVVSDALYIATILGRSLVEPHVSDSRLGKDRPSRTTAVTQSASKTSDDKWAKLGNRSGEESVEEMAEEATEVVAIRSPGARASTSVAARAAMTDADVDGARRFSGLTLRHYWDL
jgi:hypothetical protein